MPRLEFFFSSDIMLVQPTNTLHDKINTRQLHNENSKLTVTSGEIGRQAVASVLSLVNSSCQVLCCGTETGSSQQRYTDNC